MAEPNISLLGATYSGVTGVSLPKQGGGTATFPWVEGSETKTQNGTYDVTSLAEIVVNVSGGGSTNIETGTYIPSSDVAKPTISFTNTHTKLPVFAMMVDVDGYSSTTYSCIRWVYADWEQLGGAIYASSSSAQYGELRYSYRGSNTSTLSSTSVTISYSESDPTSSPNSYPRFHVTESAMYPYCGSTSRYWRKNRTYKWIAVWKP